MYHFRVCLDINSLCNIYDAYDKDHQPIIEHIVVCCQRLSHIGAFSNKSYIYFFPLLLLYS